MKSILTLALVTFSLNLHAASSLYCKYGSDVPASSDGVHNDKLLRYFDVYEQNGINLNKFILIKDVNSTNEEKYFQSSTLGKVIVGPYNVDIETANNETLSLPIISKDIYEYKRNHTYCSFYNPMTCVQEVSIAQCTTDIKLIDQLTYRVQ